MICVQSSFIKELDELVSDVHATSNEFRNQIYHSKCQVAKLVREQIQRFKGRNGLFPTGGIQSGMNYSPINQADVSTDPLCEDHPLSNETTEIDDQHLTVVQHLAEAKSYDKISGIPERAIFEGNYEKISESPRQSLLGDQDEQNLQLSTSIAEDQDTNRSGIYQYLEIFRRVPRLSKTAKQIISALVIGFLVWISLVYGAILGASMCSNGYCFLSSSRRPTIF